LILDVGCGANPRGDINTDFSLNELETDRTHLKVKLDVRSSVTNLPFPDNSFGTVFANGLLHHIPRIKPAINEMIRVASDTVFGYEPHRLNWLIRRHHHYHYHYGFKKKDLYEIFRANPKVSNVQIHYVFDVAKKIPNITLQYFLLLKKEF